MATEKEQAVRAALSDPAPSRAVLKSVRSTVALYESLVRRYPTSSYSDNALWQAGRLALEAFDKFGDPRDRDTGLRLLRWLSAEYPTSKLAKQVSSSFRRRTDRRRRRYRLPTSPAGRRLNVHRSASPTTRRDAASESPPPPTRRAGTFPSKRPKCDAPQPVPKARPLPSRRRAPLGAPAPAPDRRTITEIRRAVLSDVVGSQSRSTPRCRFTRSASAGRHESSSTSHRRGRLHP